MTGEEKGILIRHKRHDDYKFPKKRTREYKSPVVKNPVLVENYAQKTQQNRNNLYKKEKKKVL